MSGDATKAMQIKDLFAKFNFSPSSVNYGIIIKGFGSLLQFKKAISTYEEMKSLKIEMNEITLGCLIDSCVKCDFLDKAYEILKSEPNIQMNTIIYTTLIKGYTKQKNLEKALMVFQQMKSDSHNQPNTVTYNSILECAV